MKKKLDLNNLLAKYEGISSGAVKTYPYSPAKDSDYQEMPIEQDFYQSRTYNHHAQNTHTSYTITGNFQMSKSECQTFLMRIKEELRNEERGMTNFAQNSMKHIHERFHANHQKIKREILDLLDKSFRENERFITEQLRRQGSSQPPEFAPVHHQINKIDEDINRLLYGLKGAQYRKSIAETVMKDYNAELSTLKDSVKIAKEQYLTSLGEVEPDRARIDCIREDLQRLFRLSKKTANLVQNSLFSAIGTKFGGDSRVSPPKQQPRERQRKSFFNFNLGG